MLEKFLKTVKNNNIKMLLLWIFGAVIFGGSVYGLGFFNTLGSFFTETQPLVIHDGQTDIRTNYTKCETSYVFDYFYYYDGSITKPASRFYVIPVFTEESGTPKLMAVEVASDKFSVADNISNATIEGVETGEILTVKGEIGEMKPEVYSYFQEDYSGLDMELLPYVLEDESLNTRYEIFALILFLIFAVLIVFQIKSMLKNIDVDLIKEKFEEENGIGSFDDAISECEHGMVTENDIYIGTKYVAFADKEIYILKLENILWVHGYVEKQNFIPVSASIKISDKFGKTYTKAAKQRDFESIISLFQANNPRIIAGYSQQLNHLYTKNREEFIRLGEEQARQNSNTDL